MIVGKIGISVNPKNVRIVREWPKPEKLTELRGCIGLLQFFRGFIQNISWIAAQLTGLTRKEVGSTKWDDSGNDAFKVLKNAITTAPVLSAPNRKKPFMFHVDASKLAVGGIITQKDDVGRETVVVHFPRTLSPPEENCTKKDRELLRLVNF